MRKLTAQKKTEMTKYAPGKHKTHTYTGMSELTHLFLGNPRVCDLNTQIKRSQGKSSEGTRKILWEVFKRLYYLGFAALDDGGLRSAI